MSETEERFSEDLQLLSAEIRGVGTLLSSIGNFQIDGTDLFGLGLLLNRVAKKMDEVVQELEKAKS